MTSFNYFVHIYNLGNNSTSNIKICQDFPSIGLDNVDKNLRDGLFSSDVGIVNSHLSKGMHWVAYINENFFDSYGCAPPQTLPIFIINRNRHCLPSENTIQGMTSKRDSYCAAYYFYLFFLTKVLGIDFKSVVLNL